MKLKQLVSRALLPISLTTVMFATAYALPAAVSSPTTPSPTTVTQPMSPSCQMTLVNQTTAIVTDKNSGRMVLPGKSVTFTSGVCSVTSGSIPMTDSNGVTSTPSFIPAQGTVPAKATITFSKK